MPQSSLDATLVIDEHHIGLPDIAHGGYLSGLLAAALRPAAAAEVRLRRPVPTGRGLRLDDAAPDRVELRDGETLLAVATATDLRLTPPAAPTLAQARAAGARFPGHEYHMAPGCFVCSPQRPDGLGIHPGPVDGRRLVADVWTPSADVEPADAWAALDCAQLWALMTHLPAATPDVVVTASLTARQVNPVVAGEPHIVIGWPIGRDGRAWLAGAAVFGPGGELCVVGRQAAAVTGWGIPLGRNFWSAPAGR